MTMQRHTSASRSHGRPSGFTLVELLVVIGIVVLLVSILLVAVSRSYGTARKVRAQADLQAIAVALEAYKQDFGDYPRATGNLLDYQDGAWLLCRALMAPGPQTSARPLTGDGAGNVITPTDPEPGFRVRPGGQGKIYGPYLNADQFTIQTVDTGVAADPIRYYLVDKVFSSDQHPPIIYIPRSVRTLTPAQGYIDANPTPLNPLTNPNVMFDVTYVTNWATSGSWPILGTTPSVPPFPQVPPIEQIRIMMGIKTANRGNNFASAADVPAFTGPYLLWMAGEDGIFGLTNSRGARNVHTVDASGVPHFTTDDITNFNFDPAITVK